MLVSELIMYVDDKFDNEFDDETKIDIINKMEQRIYSEIIEELEKVAIDLVADTENYVITRPKMFEEIVQLEISGNQYDLGLINDNVNRQYFKENDGISLNPIPFTDEIGGMIVYFRKKPTIKTLDNIETDTLTLIDDFGIRWKALYHYYLAWKMSVLLKENDEANNWAVLYNEEESELFEWYTSKQPNNISEATKARW